MSEYDDDYEFSDMSFDDDFDKKKSFISELGTGFLNGLGETYVGSFDARVKSAGILLPSSWKTVLEKTIDLHNNADKLIDEFKKENAQTMQNLQEIASVAANKFGEDSSNKIKQGLDAFSQKDFSDWEAPRGGDDSISMEEVSNEEIFSGIKESAEQQNEILENLGQSVTNVSAKGFGGLIKSSEAGTAMLAGIDKTLNKLYQYQVNIQSRNDAVKIKLLTNTLMLNAKYYKFMEAAERRKIEELKTLNKTALMSDYQKTTTSEFVRKSIRNSMFSAVTKKAGGLKNLFIDKFGKDARKDAYGKVESSTSMLAMAASMMENGASLPEMIGGMLAGKTPDMIKKLMETQKGQQLTKWAQTSDNKMMSYARDKYAFLDDVGNALTGGINGNLENAINSMIRSGDFYKDLKHQTYEEYVESLKPGQKKLSKKKWGIANKVQQWAVDGMSNASASKGNVLNIRNGSSIRELNDPAIWNNLNNKSLNEVIPGWLSKIHLSLEKLRTGDETLEPETFSFKSNKFVSKKGLQKEIEYDLSNAANARSYGDSLTRTIEPILEGYEVSPEGKAVLLKKFSIQTRRKEFNPYDYLDMDGLSSSDKEQVNQAFSKYFGITLDTKNKMKDMDAVEKFSVLARGGETKQGRKNLAEFSKDFDYLSNNAPLSADNLQQYLNLGYEQQLLASGVIKKDKYGNYELNSDQYENYLEKGIKDSIENVNHDVYDEDYVEESDKKGRSFFGMGKSRSKGRPKGTPKASNIDFSGVEKALTDLTEKFNKLDLSKITINIDPLIEQTKESNLKLKAIYELGEDQFRFWKEMAAKGIKVGSEAPTGPTKEDKEEIKSKKGFMDRLGNMGFKNLFNKGVGKIVQNKDLVFGGLLGGALALGMNNPTMGMAVGGALIAGRMIGGLAKAKASETAYADDKSDIIDENGKVVFSAKALADGEYWDIAKNVVITTFKEITGAVKHVVKGSVTIIEVVGRKLFSAATGKAVMTAITGIKSGIEKLYNFINPLERLNGLGNSIKKAYYQMDIYIKGDKTGPILTRKGFENGAYCCLNKQGKPVIIDGFNKIQGAVYDSQTGDCIVTAAQIKDLVSSAGMSVSAAIDLGKMFGMGVAKIGAKVGKGALDGAKTVGTAVKDTIGFNGTGIIKAIDRIFLLLCRVHKIKPQSFGYQFEKTKKDKKNKQSKEKSKDNKNTTETTKQDTSKPAKIDVSSLNNPLLPGKSKPNKPKKKSWLGRLLSKGSDENEPEVDIVNDGFGNLVDKKAEVKKRAKGEVKISPDELKAQKDNERSRKLQDDAAQAQINNNRLLAGKDKKGKKKKGGGLFGILGAITKPLSLIPFLGIVLTGIFGAIKLGFGALNLLMSGSNLFRGFKLMAGIPRFLKGLGKAGFGYAASMGLDYLADKNFEEGSFGNKAFKGAARVAEYGSYAMLANTVSGGLISKGLKGLGKGVGLFLGKSKVGAKVVAGAARMGASVAAMAGPVGWAVLGVISVLALGYWIGSMIKGYYSVGKETPMFMRTTHYGSPEKCSIETKEFTERNFFGLMGLFFEKKIKENNLIVIDKNKNANFVEGFNVDDFFETYFLDDDGLPMDTGDGNKLLKSWFIKRFAPVILNYYYVLTNLTTADMEKTNAAAKEQLKKNSNDKSVRLQEGITTQKGTKIYNSVFDYYDQELNSKTKQWCEIIHTSILNDPRKPLEWTIAKQ